MKVKVGNKIYDSKNEPIMIILEDYNKKHIRNMDKKAKKYCQFPDHITEDQAREFMKTDE